MAKYKIVTVVEVEAESAEDAIDVQFHSKDAVMDTNVYCIAPRVCSECGEGMWEGYLIDGGEAYYCSEGCLLEHFTAKEWSDLYKSDGDNNYYTTWDEFDNEDDIAEPMPKCFIKINGGFISSIYTDLPGLDVETIGLDCDGLTLEEELEWEVLQEKFDASVEGLNCVL